MHDGWTALHCAAGNGHTEVVQLLISNKADVNAKNSDGKAPADLAKNKVIVSMLKRAGFTQTILAFLQANKTLTALPNISHWLHSYYAPEYAEQLRAELSARFNTKNQSGMAELEPTSTHPARYQPEEKADVTPEPLVEDNSVRLSENYTGTFYAGLALDGEGLQVLLTAPVIRRLEEELRCPCINFLIA